MKHQLALLLSRGSRLARQFAARLALATAWASLIACGDADATLVILSDTTAAPASRVVVALPYDPALLPVMATAPIPGGTLGDSVRLALARHDSAARADVAFEGARRDANEAARSLASLDRTSTAYATRFAAWMALADSAERLRDTRDALRQRFEALISRLGPAAPRLDHAVGRLRSRASADSAARVSGQEVAIATLRGESTAVSIPAGEWWVATTTEAGALMLPAHRIEMSPGGVDTLAIRSRGWGTAVRD